MITSKTGLLDTNILVYAVNQNSPFHKSARSLRDKGIGGKIPLCISPQVLTEFFAIATDSRRIEMPLTQEEAMAEMENYMRANRIRKIFQTPEATTRMFELLRQHSVTKQDIFDLQLVATLLSNGVNRIYTYNQADFAKYEGIEVLSPEAILA